MSRSDSVRQNHLAAARQGLTYGRLPLGYRPSPGGDGPAVPDPRTAPLVAALFRLVAGGRSLSGIGQALAALRPPGTGGFRVARSTLHAVLTNPFYTGKVHLNGELFPGRHEPLVSEEVFTRAHSLLSSRASRRPAR